MEMIKSIELYNFQNHKKLKIEFDPYGLNIIIGETGTGKSAIFRALYLVSDNKPAAADKLYQSPKYKIIVTTENHTIIRQPKKYTLIDEKGNEEVFEKFGTDVPDKIKKILPLKAANWQRQLSRHFLLFDTPGAAAKIINNFSGIAEQDVILGEIKKRISSTKTDFNYWSTSKGESKKTMSKLENIEEYYNLLLELKDKQKGIREKETQLLDLEEIIDNISKFEYYWRNRISTTLQIEKLVKILESKFQDLEELKNRLSDLDKTLNNLRKLAKIKDPSKFIKKIDQLKTNAVEIQTIEERLQDLGKTLKILNQNSQILEKKKEELNNKQKNFDNIMKELGICPLCEQRIK
jgi:DNA repair protein SbcC/Rad50